MLNQHRKVFFTLFAAFFILSLPFLLILSLGYDLDMQSQQLETSLTTYLEAIPRRAKIQTKAGIYRTPVELKVRQNTFTKISLELEDFQTEHFMLSAKDTNNAMKLRGIWLLPTNKSDQFDLSEGFEFVNFLSENYFLSKQNNQIFIQSLGFSGPQGEPNKLDLDFSENLQKVNFKTISATNFWNPDKNVLIYNLPQTQTWQVFDLTVLPFQTKNVAGLSPTQVILLDNKKNLWTLNLIDGTFTFLDTNISGLSYIESLNSSWILKNDAIYRLETSQNAVNLQNLDLTRNLYTQNPEIGFWSRQINETSHTSFIARNVFLGISFQIQNNLFYIADSEKDQMQIISNEAQIAGTSSNSLFWLNKDLTLNSYNLLNKNWKSFGNLQSQFKNTENLENFEIFYYPIWNRIIIYGENEVVSFWFDTINLNTAIVKYYPIKWIQNHQCLPRITRNYQFCSDSKQLIFYRNNTFVI